MAITPVTGSEENQGSNPSGIGAVVETNALDPLQVHLETLKGIDETMQQRRESQQQHLKLAYDLVGALNTDVEGAIPADITNTLMPKAQALTQMGAQFLATGGDFTNPASGKAYQQMNYAQTELNGLREQSVQANKYTHMALQALDTDARGKQELDYTASSQKIAHYLSQKLEDRSLLTDYTDLLVQKQPEFQQMVSDYMKKNYSKLDEGEDPKILNSGDYYFTKSYKENLTPDQLTAISKTMVQMPQWKAARDKAFDNLPEDQKQVYVNKYVAQGQNPALAEQNAKTDYARDIFYLFHKASTNVRFNGLTPEAKERIQKAGLDDKLASQDVIGGAIADFMTDKPGINSIQAYTPKGAPAVQLYGTTAFNNIKLGSYKVQVPVVDPQNNLPEVDANGQTKLQWINKIDYPLMAFMKNGEPFMITRQSVDKANGKGLEAEAMRFTNGMDMLLNVGGAMGGNKLSAAKANALKHNAWKNGEFDVKAMSPTDAETAKQIEAQKAKHFVNSPVDLLNPEQIAKPAIPTAKGEPTAQKEAMYVLNGKIYKQSLLEKQGYDITKLKLYK